MDENNKIILKKVKKNILVVLLYMTYFLILSFCNIFMEEIKFIEITKYFSLIILLLSILIYEISYKKDSGILAINGIELMVLSFQSLIIGYVNNKYLLGINGYIKISIFFIIAYFILKTMIFYTKERRKFLLSLSDIHEIVRNTPIKKKATKRKK